MQVARYSSSNTPRSGVGHWIASIPLLAAAASAAQAPYPGELILYSGPSTVPWPAEHAGTGPFGASAAGFYLDEDPGFAVLRGGDLFYVHSPADYSAVSPVALGEEITDVAREPGGGVDGRDALLVSSAEGLARCSFSPQTQSFVYELLDDAAALSACRRLICYRTLGDETRVAAIAANGGTISVLERETDGSYTQVVAFSPLNTSSRDLVAANLFEPGSGPDEKELVVLTNYGITYYTQQGTWIAGARSDLSGGAIALVRAQAPSTLDRVAWLAPRSSGYAFYLVGADGWQSGPGGVDGYGGTPIDLRARLDPTEQPTDPEEDYIDLTTPVTPIHMLAGDFDDDGDDDLALTIEEFGRVLVLSNDPDCEGRLFHPELVFEPAHVGHVDLTSSPASSSATNRSRPAILDFDRGPGADFALLLESEERGRFLTGMQVAPPTSSVGFEGFVAWAYFGVEPVDGEGNPTTPSWPTSAKGHLFLELANLPPDEDLQTRKLQVVVWRKASPASTDYLESVAKSNTLHDLDLGPGTSHERLFIHVELDAESYAEPQCAIFGSLPVHYFVTYRFVDWDGTAISNPSQRWIFGHTPALNPDHCTDLEHLEYMLEEHLESNDPEQFLRSTFRIPANCVDLPGNQPYSTIIIRRRLPPFQPYSPPSSSTVSQTVRESQPCPVDFGLTGIY